MSKQIQRRRGSNTDHATFTGAQGEFTYNTDTKRIHAHDGLTAGGFAAARVDELAATGGSGLVGYDGSTVQAVLDNAKPIADYTALRTYTGRASQVRITSVGIAGFFYYDIADTTSLDNGGTVIVSSNGRRWKRLFEGAVNVKWFGAKGDWNGTTGTDDTQAIQSAINACNYGDELLIGPGQYMLTDTLNLYRAITFGGVGQNNARWNQDISGVALIWNGSNAKPVIEIGGTVDSISETYKVSHGIRIHDLLLKPVTAGGGQDGILVDGSNTRYASRGYAADVVFERVAIRRFGRNEVRLMGNVFDVRFISCVLHTVIYEALKMFEAASNYTVTWPTQIYAYDTYFRGSNVADTWGIDSGSGDINLIGGGVSTVNGVKLGVGSTVFGTHFEGFKAAGSVGAWLVRSGVNFAPHIVDSYSTLIRIGTDASTTSVDTYTISCQNFYNASVGVEVTAGGNRGGTILNPTYDASVTTPYLDSRGLGNLKVINTGYNPGMDGINIAKNALIFGNNEKEFSLQYVVADLSLKLTSLNSGGSPINRLSISRRQDLQDWNWSATRHKFNRLSISGYTTAARPASPVAYEMIFDTTLNKLIVYTGTGWVDAMGAAV